MTTLVSLDQLPTGARAVVRKLRGGHEFANRLAAMGLVVGSRIEILQNADRGPLLVLVRDTRIALGRGEAMKVVAEEVSA